MTTGEEKKLSAQINELYALWQRVVIHPKRGETEDYSKGRYDGAKMMLNGLGYSVVERNAQIEIFFNNHGGKNGTKVQEV